MPLPARRVLVLFAHPALESSRVNRRLIEAPLSVEGVTFRDLYELYPDYDVDVEAEQSALLGHDIVIFHHPLYWYSAPPLIKQWQDLVLEHGWAYGPGGTALADKVALHVITAGGPEAAYVRGGSNRYSLTEFLRPFEATARLCRMHYLPPFVVHGTHAITAAETDRHVADYRRLLAALCDGTLDWTRAGKLAQLNADLGVLITTEPFAGAPQGATDGG